MRTATVDYDTAVHKPLTVVRLVTETETTEVVIACPADASRRLAEDLRRVALRTGRRIRIRGTHTTSLRVTGYPHE